MVIRPVTSEEFKLSSDDEYFKTSWISVDSEEESGAPASSVKETSLILVEQSAKKVLESLPFQGSQTKYIRDIDSHSFQGRESFVNRSLVQKSAIISAFFYGCSELFSGRIIRTRELSVIRLSQNWSFPNFIHFLGFVSQEHLHLSYFFSEQYSTDYIDSLKRKTEMGKSGITIPDIIAVVGNLKFLTREIGNKLFSIIVSEYIASSRNGYGFSSVETICQTLFAVQGFKEELQKRPLDLDFHGSKINDDDLVSLARIFPNTRSLILNNTSIHTIPTGFLNLERIKALYAYNLRTVSGLDYSPYLKEVNFEETGITSAPRGCPSLEIFNAKGARKLKDISGLDKCRNLKIIDVSWTEVIRAPIGCIALESFSASHAFNFFDCSGLDGLQNLKEVNLQATLLDPSTTRPKLDDCWLQSHGFKIDRLSDLVEMVKKFILLAEKIREQYPIGGTFWSHFRGTEGPVLMTAEGENYLDFSIYCDQGKIGFVRGKGGLENALECFVNKALEDPSIESADLVTLSKKIRLIFQERGWHWREPLVFFNVVEEDSLLSKAILVPISFYAASSIGKEMTFKLPLGSSIEDFERLVGLYRQSYGEITEIGKYHPMEEDSSIGRIAKELFSIGS